MDLKLFFLNYNKMNIIIPIGDGYDARGFFLGGVKYGKDGYCEG